MRHIVSLTLWNVRIPLDVIMAHLSYLWPRRTNLLPGRISRESGRQTIANLRIYFLNDPTEGGALVYVWASGLRGGSALVLALPLP